MSEDMSPHCSAHDEWLIMKLCIHVGYHDANNVSHFGSDSVTQLNLKNVKKNVYAVLQARRTIAVTRPLDLRLLLRDHAQTTAVWKAIHVPAKAQLWYYYGGISNPKRSLHLFCRLSNT